MSRQIGDALFSANFEVRKAEPLDSRTIVDAKADLTLLATWNKGDGNAYVYKGMPVAVVADATPANNGIYWLKDEDYTDIANWEKVGADSDALELVGAYVRDIVLGDWVASGDKFILEIPAATHLQSDDKYLVVNVFQTDTSNSNIITSYEIAANGDVTINTDETFAGYLMISNLGVPSQGRFLEAPTDGKNYGRKDGAWSEIFKFKEPSNVGLQDVDNMKAYLEELAEKNENVEPIHIVIKATSETLAASAYQGGAYFPEADAVVLAPFVAISGNAQGDWHYIDGKTGLIKTYSVGYGLTGPNGYFGAVYDPVNKKVIFVPYGESDNTSWVRVLIGNSGTISGVELMPEPYAHGATVVKYAYAYGCYSPVQKRIYFCPSSQATQANWHYYDCETETVVSYAHGATIVNGDYSGMVYSPTQNRIYFVPRLRADASTWHYIDCATGNVVEYTHGATAVDGAYYGGVYSPTQNRIYFVPSEQATQANWHYVDCNTGAVVAYAHGSTSTITAGSAYRGGALCPTTNRIVLSPQANSVATEWHYIDCNTGAVGTYPTGHSHVSSAYQGALYVPNLNAVIPYPDAEYAQGIVTIIGNTAKAEISTNTASNVMLASTL